MKSGVWSCGSLRSDCSPFRHTSCATFPIGDGNWRNLNVCHSEQSEESFLLVLLWYRIRYVLFFPPLHCTQLSSSAHSCRGALTFADCGKSKQKHAFAIRFARSQITAVPLLFIFMWAPFLLTIDIHFINYFIGNFPLLRIVSSLLGSGQLNSKLPFMKESAMPVLTR